jgi:peroxidase
MHKTPGESGSKPGSKEFTHMVMQFGQFLDHDITLTPEGELECCDHEILKRDNSTEDPRLKRCFNIEVSKDDPHFNEFPEIQRGEKPCFPFTRSDIFCPQGENPREQMNGITAFIDGSNIYGSTEEVAIGLRVNETFGTEKFPGALLRTGLSKHTAGQNHEALPSRKQCRFASPRPVPTPDDLTSGDTRAVVQPGLTSMHTLFLHEHNRIARELESLWASEAETKDLSARTGAEFVFELARKLVGAELQQVTYQEFLPIVLGTKAFGNLGARDTEYDPDVDPSILNEFATVAFRFGHSIIHDTFNSEVPWLLKDHFFERNGTNQTGFSFVLGNQWQHTMVGLANQIAPEMDLFVSDAMRNTLFENVDRPGDVVARNIQRGRDHGIPGYEKLRLACKMTAIVGTEAPEESVRRTGGS